MARKKETDAEICARKIRELLLEYRCEIHDSESELIWFYVVDKDTDEKIEV